MKIKYLFYLLLGSIFSIGQTSADNTSKTTDIQKTSNSKILNNHWSGTYMGLQYSFGIDRYDNPSLKSTPSKKHSLNYQTTNNGDETNESVKNFPSSVGLLLGYNQAITQWVLFGAELDVSFKLNANELYYTETIVPKHGFPIRVNRLELPFTSYLDSTLRARVGLNLSDFSPYLAGGINVAYDLSSPNMEQYAKNMLQDMLTESKFKKEELDNIITKIEGSNDLYIGWSLGTGFEYKINRNLTLRTEYRYSNSFSNHNKKITYTNTKAEKENTTLTYCLDNLSRHDVRLGVSYYF
ncbi:outer membrane protein [Bartonella sp. DGB1]|uniref:outer membrane protein n=1 Tax=Bartonella sp. DGB1 TaxID=3239807 RepID=UPI003523E753